MNLNKHNKLERLPTKRVVIQMDDSYLPLQQWLFKDMSISSIHIQEDGLNLVIKLVDELDQLRKQLDQTQLISLTHIQEELDCHVAQHHHQVAQKSEDNEDGKTEGQ